MKQTKNKKPTIYVAGPMSGIENFNHAAFFEAEARLKSKGWEVRNPARNTGNCYKQYLFKGLRMLFECDAICLLPNWEKSPGAKAEYFTSHALKLPSLLMLEGHFIMTPEDLFRKSEKTEGGAK
jgi:hypothetical protein